MKHSQHQQPHVRNSDKLIYQDKKGSFGHMSHNNSAHQSLIDQSNRVLSPNSAMRMRVAEKARLKLANYMVPVIEEDSCDPNNFDS